VSQWFVGTWLATITTIQSQVSPKDRASTDPPVKDIVGTVGDRSNSSAGRYLSSPICEDMGGVRGSSEIVPVPELLRAASYGRHGIYGAW
jgi:hypothetical protein